MSGIGEDPCWCSLCGIRVPAVQEMAKHLEGKKHLRLMASNEARQRHEKQSVFVRNFQPGTTAAELGAAFKEIGLIEKIIFDKNSDSPKYAIVEFAEQHAVEKALNSPAPLMLNNQRLVVKSRNVKAAEKSTAKKSPHKKLSDQPPEAVRADAPKMKGEKMDADESTTNESDLFTPVRVRLNAAASVDDQFRCLMTLQGLGDDDVQNRQELAERISAALKVHVYSPSADLTVRLYGSATTGFGLKSSDIDMTLLTGPEPVAPEQDKVAEVTMLDDLDHAKLTSADSSFASSADSSVVGAASPKTHGRASGTDVDKIKEELDAIACAVRHHVAGCSRVFTIPKARRPVVRWHNMDLKLQCDLTVNNRLAVENSRLLRMYAQFDRRVPLVVHAVRAWATNHGLSGSSASLLSGYSLSLLVIAFLQRTRPPVLPCLQSPPSCPVPGKPTGPVVSSMTGGWQCTVYDNHPPGVNFDTPDTLLHDFFVFYGAFDFGTNAVAIHMPSSSAVTISDVMLLSAQRVDEYSSSGDSGLARMSVFRQSAVCVQDPFEVTHNVNAGVGPPLLRRLVDQCRSAALVYQTDWAKQPPSPATTSLHADGQLPDWGLAQLISPPAGPGVRFLSISLSADQVSALFSKASAVASSSSHSEEGVLRLAADLFTSDFGFSTELKLVDGQPSSGSRCVTAQSSDGESDDNDVERRGAPGKAKRLTRSSAATAAKRVCSPPTAACTPGNGAQAVPAAHFQANCEARENTWLHRRRWRRELQRRQEQQCSSARAAATPTPASSSNAAAAVLLSFQLHVIKEPSAGPCMYSLVFQPTDTRFMNELHIFVAVFRKDLLQKISS